MVQNRRNIKRGYKGSSMISYRKIRGIAYKRSRDSSKRNNEDFDNFLRWPYTNIKGRIYVELAALLVFLVQNTRIKPNQITMMYAICGVVGAFFLSSGNDSMIYVGLGIFFLKSVLDWADGLLATIKNNLTEEGGVLDPWGAYVNSQGFIIGIGLYVFDSTNDLNYLYILIVILALRSIDLRNYTYTFYMSKLINNDLKILYPYDDVVNEISKLPISIKSLNKNKGDALTRIAKIIFSILDDRSKSVDFICLVIVIELYVGQVLASNYILYLLLLKYSLFIAGGWFLVYYKKLPSKIKNLFSAEVNEDIKKNGE